MMMAVLAIGSTTLAQAPNVSGRVHAPGGAPLEGVDVRVQGTDLRTRTDQSGSFALASVPKGPHEVVFRRLGYLPASVTVSVPETSDTIAVTMVPRTPALDTVKVVASLNVLAGIVVDSSKRPIAGATVNLIGSKNAEAETDPQGFFTFTSVQSGPVVLRVRKEGYALAMHSIRLEDWRGLWLRMERLAAGLSASKRAQQSGFGNTATFVWSETRQRLAQRGVRAAIVPREELAPLDGMPLAQAIRRTRSGALAMSELSSVADYVCVLEDGHRTIGFTTLDTFHADDVEFVELYPPGTEFTGTLAQYVRGAGCLRSASASSRRRGIFYAVVWTRS